jgi:uncharacterized protein YdaU (DUF1376 family)
MSERPFMQLYVSDFLGDTLHLSTEQIGAYMLLLMAMWNAGGSLPDDDAKLARVCRMSIKKWRVVSDDLMAFFQRENGQVLHNRLTKEIKKSESKSELRASAGAEGGRAKALKDKEARLAKATVLPQHLPDTITRSSSSLRSEHKPAGFNEFWAMYPNKVGKPDAERKFAKALAKTDLETLMAGLRRYVAKTDDRPWCNPSTWLNQERWADQPAVGPPRFSKPTPKPTSNPFFKLADDLDGNERSLTGVNGDRPDVRGVSYRVIEANR